MAPDSPVPLRIVTTNDLFGAFFPVPTSYGSLPGGHALTATVDRLRESARASCWIDAGDFAGGGPLAPATGGIAAWLAASTLGIDIAVPGNHEFDYGDDAFAAQANASSLSLLSTDLHASSSAVGKPGPAVAAHNIIEAPGVPATGLIGLTFPERRGLFVYDIPADHESAVDLVLSAAADLRAQGAGRVVLVMHEGIPATPGVIDLVPGGQFWRINEFCGAVDGLVDAVIGGHTCGHFAGELNGVAFLQPWPYGAEVGVLDIDARGVHVGTVPVLARYGQAWTGPGAEVYDQLSAQVVGVLPRPLTTPGSGMSDDLRDAVSTGLVELTGASAALVHASDVGCVQPAMDGCFAYLPPGPVTEADILRILPWAGGELGDGVYGAELASAEVDLLIDGFTSEDSMRPGCTRRGAGGTTLVSRNYLDKARRLLSTAHDWQPVGFGQRDGLRHWISATGGGR